MCAILAATASTASAKIHYRTSDQSFIASFKAAIAELRACDDCKHDRRLQTMLDFMESEDKTAPTFHVAKAVVEEKDGVKYPGPKCTVAGNQYRPGKRQDVIIHYWPSEFSLFSKECPAGQKTPDGAGVYTTGSILAHELAHCYYVAQGRKIADGNTERAAVEEQYRAIAFENIYRRCKDSTPRYCAEGRDISTNGVTWPDGRSRDQISVLNPCQCSPSGENGPADCNKVLGAGADGVCCDFQCFDQSRDVKNCGKCGAQCDGDQACCSGACKDLKSDVKNCGSCGHWCPHSGAQMPCENSTCTCKTACGSCSGYQCNGTCDYCPDEGIPPGVQDHCCWCGGDGCIQ
jgi:hypothetical protein